MNLYYVQFHNLPALYVIGDSIQVATEKAREAVTEPIRATVFGKTVPPPPILVRVELIADNAGATGIRLIDARPGCIPPANEA